VGVIRLGWSAGEVLEFLGMNCELYSWRRGTHLLYHAFTKCEIRTFHTSRSLLRVMKREVMCCNPKNLLDEKILV
jgi:hypothetical protein